ncbi:hypothetical protein DWB85_14000 [Seongchinamella sediminis]|uniref:Chain length determinant protein n=1 Tax=Seongchinamella sediminis TaxID=2283635 RepID=A0A3L7DX90_9GAMM|nr:Wzz/FepE/Etk N-terminal domain-containing protein [Seongchinamella sediminis]RLQ21189.1 hypothetical protein DWB85_14000 [Seongchinamella sediminis]
MPSTQQDNGVGPYQYCRDDEIDLFELMEGLWRQKWLIAAFICASALAAVVAVFAMSPSYRAEAFIRVPLKSQISEIADYRSETSDQLPLNSKESKSEEPSLIELNPTLALQRVEEEILSLNIRRRVFDNNIDELLSGTIADDDALNTAFLNGFNPALTLTTPSRAGNIKDEGRRTVAFEHSDPKLAAAIVNELIETASASAKANLIVEFKSLVSSRIAQLTKQLQQKTDNQALQDGDQIAQLMEQDRLRKLQLEDEIAAMKAMAAKERQDQIIRLEEALAVARDLQITEPTTLAVMAQRRAGSGGSVAVTADLSQVSEPIYLKGTRVLSAELAALRARESDDQHIPELRQLEMELALLDSNRKIEVLKAREDFAPFIDGAWELREEISELEGLLFQNFDGLSLMRVDQPAVVPTSPIKPRKSLILSAALVAGGMLGVFVALIRNAAIARRERLAVPD